MMEGHRMTVQSLAIGWSMVPSVPEEKCSQKCCSDLRANECHCHGWVTGAMHRVGPAACQLAALSQAVQVELEKEMETLVDHVVESIVHPMWVLLDVACHRQ